MAVSRPYGAGFFHPGDLQCISGIIRVRSPFEPIYRCFLWFFGFAGIDYFMLFKDMVISKQQQQAFYGQALVKLVGNTLSR